jgi:DNA-binding transcriptional MerR regulator
MDPKRDDLMTIGRFARASRLSVKALRLYARKGLLPPSYIDPSNGYRYYDRDQLRQVRKILLLRRVGMPLEMIRELLDSESEAAKVLLERYWRSEVEKQSVRSQVVAYLQAYLEGEERGMSFTVKSKRLPEMSTISVAQQVSIEDLPNYLTSTIERLQNMVRSQGSKSAGPPIVRYHGQVNEDSDGPVEVCLPINKPIEIDDDLELKEWPEVDVAYTMVTKRQGMFPEVLGAYDACHDWIRERGARFEGSPMEIYAYDPEEGGLDDPFFEVAWAYR